VSGLVGLRARRRKSCSRRPGEGFLAAIPAAIPPCAGGSRRTPTGSVGARRGGPWTAETYLSKPVLRVVACEEPRPLGALLADVPERDVVVWVSGLEELALPPEDLAAYGTRPASHPRGADVRARPALD
jgi:hypothetical protein